MNLLTDPWVPVLEQNNRPGEASLLRLLTDGSILDITGQPMTRLAVLRLLMAMKAWRDRGGDDFQEQSFSLSTFLQTALPAECKGLRPELIIQMSDKNGVAWSPTPRKPSPPEIFAQAVVTAYFCDRGGLKARVPGLSISGQTPFHVGTQVRMVSGETVLERLDNNPVDWEPDDYQPPWVGGVKFPEGSKPRHDLELLLWPWRRVCITDNGVVVAPGAVMSTEVKDPWVLGKALVRHYRDKPEEGFEITNLALQQASPLACWISRPCKQSVVF